MQCLWSSILTFSSTPRKTRYATSSTPVNFAHYNLMLVFPVCRRARAMQPICSRRQPPSLTTCRQSITFFILICKHIFPSVMLHLSLLRAQERKICSSLAIPTLCPSLILLFFLSLTFIVLVFPPSQTPTHRNSTYTHNIFLSHTQARTYTHKSKRPTQANEQHTLSFSHTHTHTHFAVSQFTDYFMDF